MLYTTHVSHVTASAAEHVKHVVLLANANPAQAKEYANPAIETNVNPAQAKNPAQAQEYANKIAVAQAKESSRIKLAIRSNPKPIQLIPSLYSCPLCSVTAMFFVCGPMCFSRCSV
jgi:hypothetical protein